jgi:hypothetical protein
LTFCLLGVAAPADLIQDVRTTPFNIGRRIELNDFTEQEAAPLAEGLGNQEIGEMGKWGGVASARSLLDGRASESDAAAGASRGERAEWGLNHSPTH